jgi:two-component system, NarL family, invasion response regulator UvrY
MNLIIADDHEIVRKGIVQLLYMEDRLGIRNIDEASSGEELLSRLRRNKYDIVILDISMPGMGGLEALKEIVASYSATPVLILSTHSEEQYAIRVLKAGARGYVRKSSGTEELVKAIEKIISGRKYFSESVAEKLLDIGRKNMPHEILSDREYQIMVNIAIGKTQKQIGDELSLSIKTISTYRKRILDKIGFKDNNDIFRYCSNHGLIEG